QISNHHARFVLGGDGNISVEDTGSTNGVYLNGARITSRLPVQPGDIVQIGPFIVQAHRHTDAQTDAGAGVAVFDTRSKTRLDAVQITKEVSDRARGTIRLLDDVALTIQPNEFVGLLGPSGAGKSTLMDALNGTRPATAGRVLINNLDLYQHLESLKQSIGYVPQDDIIHRELTVYRTLYYVARLRLSRDVSAEEIDQIVSEVMDVTGLGERRDVAVAQLSGGQRKRVSIAVELLTKPSVIFLDEPTSGLDPATEEKIMRLFRQIAESGRTVILTTHAMENVRLFDKIAILMRGKLIFYGTPREALAHVGAESFRDLFEKLEESTATGQGGLSALPPNATDEQKRAYDGGRNEVAEEWRRRFHGTEVYQRNVVEPLSGLTHDAQTSGVAHRRPTIADAVRQFVTLVRRYAEVLRRDRLNLLILFAQAPIIAVLTFLVVGTDKPRDFPYFLLALVALWFGTSVAAREIVKERAVYKRERMVNLSLLPYVGSKLFVLSLIVGAQCVLLFGTLKFLSTVFSSAGYLPGNFFQLGAQLLTLILTGMVGIALGLFVSAIVKTSEMATSLVPLILIPQLLFSGLVGVPEGAARVVGAAMPATWAFDELKRLSGLDTLRAEGANAAGSNAERGLYKQIEHENEQVINQARKDIADYRARAERDVKDYGQKVREILQRNSAGAQSGAPPEPPVLGPPPAVKEARNIDTNLSGYVEFLHPWGGVASNAAVLTVMLLIFFGSTVMALRFRDSH
ncbi:MAG TPA: ATP-binding cassette domain-containing protein, partial [Pyrinomonadaceae bacterium]|nr:ATP-binding cassette domain-containing protein [Pyrinomonadaceae bacterium]